MWCRRDGELAPFLPERPWLGSGGGGDDGGEAIRWCERSRGPGAPIDLALPLMMKRDLNCGGM